MKIFNLISILKSTKLLIETKKIDDIKVKGVQFDSRKIKKDDIFVAIKGYDSDGHNFIQNAI